ncbi:MAG: CcoQ/FixQ family Cbb3-type cytochrome c oxidase assembly chaperone [Chitinophagaceae bacterium]|nr:MAG: CcoQ/FixQ family Cbb3-type cytochrome c oxidase assembly chaperone [Chitinophagaceae bacterium]
MLKYIKSYADSIEGIDIYPIISLFIFVLFFIAVIYYVKKMDKRHVEEIKHLPLDLDEAASQPFQTLKKA